MIKTEKLNGGLQVAIKGNSDEIAVDMMHIGRSFTSEELKERRMLVLTSFLDGLEATKEEVDAAMRIVKVLNFVHSKEHDETPDEDTSTEALS